MLSVETEAPAQLYRPLPELLPRSQARFSFTFMISLTAMAVFYLALVRIVDPRGEFGGQIFPQAVISARAEKRALFAAYQQHGPIQGVILGSSRSFKLRPTDFETRLGLRFFNFAVDNARAEDYLSIYRWIRHRGAHPKRLVIGVDVEALHNDDRPDDRFAHDEILHRALWGALDRRPGPKERLCLLLLSLKKQKDTFSIRYLGDTLRSMSAAWKGLAARRRTSRFQNDGYLIDPPAEKRGAEPQSLEARLVSSFPDYLDRLRGMSGLSASRRGYLEQLIREGQADGAHIEIWLSPIHPRTAAYLESHLKGQPGYLALLATTRSYLARLHARYGIETYDCSDPSSFHGTLAGWLDGGHMDAANSSRVVTRLTARA